jgi:hypothetical protein
VRVLVCGGRDFAVTDEQCEFIWKELNAFNNITTIISGMARGVDTQAALWGELKGKEVLKYPADWKKYGKLAGPIP